ncbi:hypothetical protein CO675_25910 [Bradyrhizobium sp. C9]|nr:hypothetical protein CO675_25910 [Bradyrhizobium sp. C9]
MRSQGYHVARMLKYGPQTAHIFDVVLAKARTHYPKCQLRCDAGATARLSTNIGGYGFLAFVRTPIGQMAAS